MDLHASKEKNELTAIFELPGMKKEDVSIDVHNNRLIVSGKSSISKDVEKDDYIRRERNFGSFSRSLPLPNGISVSFPDTSLSFIDVLLTRLYRQRVLKQAWKMES